MENDRGWEGGIFMNQKKRVTWFLFSVCVLCMLFAVSVAAKGKKPASKNVPKKIVLNQKEILMYPGEEKKVAVEQVKPEEASPDVTWKSKKKAVATVSPNGQVKARKPGKTVIMATSKKNPKVMAVVKVTVKKRPEKREKKCVCEGKRHFYGDGILNDYARRQHQTTVIFRSKEDIRSYVKKVYEEYFKRKHIRGKVPKDMLRTFLTEYLKMDFQKESLAVFFDRNLEIASLQTEFDGEGKLRGIVKFRHDFSQPEKSGTIKKGVITFCATALKLRRQDEAMIDYYEFEREETPQAEQ